MPVKILLDPKVVLNPLSFALHLAVFAEAGSPVAVPLGWLWEEVQEQHQLLVIGDIFNFHAGVGTATMETSIYDSRNSHLSPSAALLAAASRRGLVRPVATTDVGEFLRIADWASFLSNLVGGKWVEEKVPKVIFEKAEAIAAKEAAAEFGVRPDEIRDIYDRNRRWSERSAEEYPIYERYRMLMVELGQLYAFLSAGYKVSTPAERTRRLVRDTFGTHGLIKPLEPRTSLLPVVRKVQFDPRVFSVGDVLAMAENRELLGKLGAADIAFANLGRQEKQAKFVKNLAIYLLGLIPVVGSVASLVGGVDLLGEAATLARNASDGESILYADVDDFQLRDEV